MARVRLGKAERELRRQQWNLFRSLRSDVVSANLSQPKPDRIRYATVKAERSMTHGLYRGLYDPLYSTDKDTKRGMKPVKTSGVRGSVFVQTK